MSDYSPRSLAYLGDAVFELWVREHATRQIKNAETLHKYVTARVNGEFQCKLLESLEGFLSDDEKDIIRQGRNAPLSVGRRSNPNIHRHASGFEALIGHLYLTDKTRLEALFNQLQPLLDSETT